MQSASTPAKFGQGTLHPVAVTIFGGLISATLLDAFVTPPNDTVVSARFK